MTNKLKRPIHQQCIPATNCRQADLSTSTTVISEVAGIHTSAGFAEMNWTLDNFKQFTVCFECSNILCFSYS